MTNKFKNFSILYIEDDDGIRDINFSMFKRMFKNVYIASNGEEGYKSYIENKPNIILTDIKMPIMDGIELSKKIREKDENVKIIIATAYCDEKYLLEAVELNLERFLIKPLTNRNLIPALEKAIKKIHQKIYLCENFYFDYLDSQFYLENNLLALSKKELLLLSLLVKQHNKIVSYEQIEDEIWGYEYMSLKSLRTIIGLLRKKIPKKTIKNISNIGYKLEITIDKY